jgi:hypothetical protein
MEERQMAKARKHAQRKRAKSLIGSIQEFLTPVVFKQVRNASKRRKSPRWDLHPLLYILVLTTYCCADSLPEKFELAGTFYAASCPKRKRPGKHFSGSEKAAAALIVTTGETALPLLVIQRLLSLWRTSRIPYETSSLICVRRIAAPSPFFSPAFCGHCKLRRYSLYFGETWSEWKTDETRLDDRFRP